jgi:Lar family restriction alleviation protein
MQLEDELKPRPFCGGTEMTVFIGVFDNPTYVLCKKCHAQGPGGKKLKEAMALWNKRKEGL